MNRDPRSLDPLALPLHQYVMLDTETTGLDPRTGARLLEIGMARGDMLSPLIEAGASCSRTLTDSVSTGYPRMPYGS